MLEPVTILTALAYAITKSAAADPNTMLGTGGDLLAQLFGGAAGNAFHGDLEKLRVAFLNITKPDKNQDLERAAARSALHANLFCLMVALGEPSPLRASWRNGGSALQNACHKPCATFAVLREASSKTLSEFNS